MAHMYDRVVSIISKPAEERTEMEIDQILPWFRKKSDLFRTLQPGVVKDIVKNCRFEVREKDSVVIRQGDKGDRFYVILNGGVSIYINPALADAENDAVRMQAEDQLLQAIEQQQSDDGLLEKKKLDVSKFGNFIGRIDTGKSFGELALINKDCVRNASIITDVCTDLLIVDRELYNRSLHAYQAQDFAQRRQFTSQFPLFSNWQPRYKKQMSMSLRKEVIPFDGTIVKQGDPVDALYFVLSGQAKLIVDASQHMVQFPNVYPLDNIDQLEKEEARGSIRRETITEKPKIADKVNRTPSIIRKANHEKKLQRFLELCVVGAVEIIGDLEVIMDLGTYTHTAICTQETEIYVLNMKNYERLVQKRNPSTVETMRQIVETKLGVRCSRLVNGQAPLLPYLLYRLRCKSNPKKEPPSIWDRTNSETTWKVFGFQRGPIIDLYGPGTVFHMIRMRDKARKHAKARARMLAGGGRNRPDAQKKTDKKGNSNKKTLNNDIAITVDDVDGSDYIGQGHPLIDCHDLSPRRTGYHDSDGDRHDFSTSDSALSELEDKIRAWHCGFSSASVTKATKRTVKLHRYNPEDNKTPKPGKKVFIRKRAPRKMSEFLPCNDTDDDEDFLTLPRQQTNLRRSETSFLSELTDVYLSPTSDTEAESEVQEELHIRRLQISKGHSQDQTKDVRIRSEPDRQGQHFTELIVLPDIRSHRSILA